MNSNVLFHYDGKIDGKSNILSILTSSLLAMPMRVRGCVKFSIHFPHSESWIRIRGSNQKNKFLPFFSSFIYIHVYQWNSERTRLKPSQAKPKEVREKMPKLEKDGKCWARSFEMYCNNFCIDFCIFDVTMARWGWEWGWRPTYKFIYSTVALTSCRKFIFFDECWVDHWLVFFQIFFSS